jgi:hypothetical protein
MPEVMLSLVWQWVVCPGRCDQRDIAWRTQPFHVRAQPSHIEIECVALTFGAEEDYWTVTDGGNGSMHCGGRQWVSLQGLTLPSYRTCLGDGDDEVEEIALSQLDASNVDSLMNHPWDTKRQ